MREWIYTDRGPLYTPDNALIDEQLSIVLSLLMSLAEIRYLPYNQPCLTSATESSLHVEAVCGCWSGVAECRTKIRCGSGVAAGQVWDQCVAVSQVWLNVRRRSGVDPVCLLVRCGSSVWLNVNEDQVWIRCACWSVCGCWSGVVVGKTVRCGSGVAVGGTATCGPCVRLLVRRPGVTSSRAIAIFNQTDILAF
ncbi:hypothetical protein RRG08_002865 [Elysia crispata]|uniref:Uncharacterized protein n=1 Tax=Elysia crispata TaxID=231223 RepID=A0AAE0XV54_9GAST|nr:hypothetical protein RRG08_002865 [Elysia crispata]